MGDACSKPNDDTAPRSQSGIAKDKKELITEISADKDKKSKNQQNKKDDWVVLDEDYEEQDNEVENDDGNH